jgi:ribose 5-phosphate isomerase B
MKLALGADHRGAELRGRLAAWLRAAGHAAAEFGAAGQEAYDYPNAADAVAEAVRSGAAELGVLICGSGIGVSIRANRHSGVRAALCCGPELASAARRHNHANILCVGADRTSEEDAIAMLQRFIETPEDQDERHARRVRMLDAPA